jgi:hypothetical protein
MNKQNTHKQEEFSAEKSPFIKNKFKNFTIKTSNTILKYFKLELKKIEDGYGFIYPPEIPHEDASIMSDVLDLGLTMVSRERLIATAMACNYVISKKIQGDFVECGVWRGGYQL